VAQNYRPNLGLLLETKKVNLFELALDGRPIPAQGRLQPKTPFSRLPLFHRADLGLQLRVELTRLPSLQRRAAFCAQPKAGVDVNLPLQIAALIGRTPVLPEAISAGALPAPFETVAIERHRREAEVARYVGEAASGVILAALHRGACRRRCAHSDKGGWGRARYHEAGPCGRPRPSNRTRSVDAADQKDVAHRVLRLGSID
jgi:hypothetical protein